MVRRRVGCDLRYRVVLFIVSTSGRVSGYAGQPAAEYLMHAGSDVDDHRRDQSRVRCIASARFVEARDRRTRAFLKEDVLSVWVSCGSDDELQRGAESDGGALGELRKTTRHRADSFRRARGGGQRDRVSPDAGIPDDVAASHCCCGRKQLQHRQSGAKQGAHFNFARDAEVWALCEVLPSWSAGLLHRDAFCDASARCVCGARRAWRVAVRRLRRWQIDSVLCMRAIGVDLRLRRRSLSPELQQRRTGGDR